MKANVVMIANLTNPKATTNDFALNFALTISSVSVTNKFQTEKFEKFIMF